MIHEKGPAAPSFRLRRARGGERAATKELVWNEVEDGATANPDSTRPEEVRSNSEGLAHPEISSQAQVVIVIETFLPYFRLIKSLRASFFDMGATRY